MASATPEPSVPEPSVLDAQRHLVEESLEADNFFGVNFNGEIPSSQAQKNVFQHSAVTALSCVQPGQILSERSRFLSELKALLPESGQFAPLRSCLERIMERSSSQWKPVTSDKPSLMPQLVGTASGTASIDPAGAGAAGVIGFTPRNFLEALGVEVLHENPADGLGAHLMELLPAIVELDVSSANSLYDIFGIVDQSEITPLLLGANALSTSNEQLVDSIDSFDPPNGVSAVFASPLIHRSEYFNWLVSTNLDHKVIVNIPFVNNAETLSFSLRMAGVTEPESDPVYGRQIDYFKRAERDGWLPRAQIDFTEGMVDFWRSRGSNIILSNGQDPSTFLPFCKLIVDMGSSHRFKATNNTVTRFVAREESLDPEKVSGATLLSDFHTEMWRMGIRSTASTNHVSKGKIKTAGELLLTVSDAFRTAYQADQNPNKDQTWSDVRVHVGNFTKGKISNPEDPDFELVTVQGVEGEEPPFEFRINTFPYVTKKSEGEEAVPDFQKISERLAEEIRRFQRKQFAPMDVELIDDTPVELHRTTLCNFTSEGYAAAKYGDFDLGITATKPGFVALSAETFVQNLRASPDIDQPVILEVGAFGANGIVELVEELNVLAKSNPDLADKIQSTRIVFSDIYQASIDSGKAVIDQAIADGKIVGDYQFDYILLNGVDKDTVLTQYEQRGISQNVLLSRFVNVLDAIPSSHVKLVDGELYKVLGRTGLPDGHRDALLNKVEWYDEPDTKEGYTVLDPKELGITPEILVATLKAAHLDDIPKELLDENIQGDDALSSFSNWKKMPLPTRFISLLKEKYNGLPDMAAGLIYRELVKQLRVYHTYEKVDPENYEWVQDGDTKVDTKILTDTIRPTRYEGFIPDMRFALEAVATTFESLHENGSMILTQMTAQKSFARAHTPRNLMILPPTNAHAVDGALLSSFAERYLDKKIRIATESPSGIQLDDKSNVCVVLSS